MTSIQRLNPETFAPYGTIIDFTNAKDDGWEILVEANDPGWRIALLEIDRHTSNTLEYHPASRESFEPVSGVSLIIVAPYESPETFEVFLLDRPVCLHKRIWHQVICLSDKAVMKITENLNVECVYLELNSPIEVKVL